MIVPVSPTRAYLCVAGTGSWKEKDNCVRIAQIRNAYVSKWLCLHATLDKKDAALSCQRDQEEVPRNQWPSNVKCTAGHEKWLQ